MIGSTRIIYIRNKWIGPTYLTIWTRRPRMQIIVYADNIEKDCQTVMSIDWKNLDKKVKDRPEDYIFILSPEEMDKFNELNEQMLAGMRGKGMTINETEYINQYAGVFVIATLAVQPDFARRYKIGFFTHKVLGKSHAVFYIDRSTDDMERANAVLRRIIDFKANLNKEQDRKN
jgi:hypothetical protein